MKNKQKIVALFIISILLFQNLHSALAKNEKQELSSFKGEIRIKPKTKKPNYQYKEDKVLVKYKEKKIDLDKSSGQKKAISIESIRGLKELKSFKNSNTKILQTDGSIDKTIEELEKDPNVEYVEKNAVRYPLTLPNDTFFSYQWALNNTGQTFPASTGGSTSGTADADMDAAEAWDTENSANQEIVVAVIDTGARLTHEDLAANIWTNADEIPANGIDDDANGYVDDVHGWDFKDNDNDPSDSVFNYCYQYSGQICIDQEDVSGHGTFISGIIAAVHNNAKGISGVSSKNKIKIMPLRFDLDTATELEAIEYAKNNGAKVINASYGAGTPDLAEKNAIEAFPGVFVAAAGNDATDNETSHFYPSDYTSANIISVAATDQNDNLSLFSNYGNISVDLGAPGQNLASTYHTSDTYYATGDGTSFAAPYVSGVAGMLLSANPSLSISSLKNNILNTGDPIASLSGKTVTDRRLNMLNALNSVLKVQAPIADKTSGTYNNSVSVSLSTSTSGASIYYTLDGTNPTSSSALYSSPITISTTTTLKAIAIKSGMTNSDIATATYSFKAATPAASPSGGTYTEPQSVTLASATTGASIYYTLDGSDPTISSTLYSSPISISTNTTLKAIAIKAGFTNSDIFNNEYKFITSIPIHRFWSDQKQGHFYTANEDEKNHIIATYSQDIWKYEGIAYSSFSSTETNLSPIYRFWSDQKQHHFYTASEDEKNYVIANYPTNVWKYEGIAYYTYTIQQSGTTAVYRFWSDQKQGHFYTSNEDEKNYIIENYPINIWKYEGIAWYVPNN